MLVLVTLGDASVRQVASDPADQLIAEAHWIDGLPTGSRAAILCLPAKFLARPWPESAFPVAAAGLASAGRTWFGIAIFAARRLIQLGTQPVDPGGAGDPLVRRAGAGQFRMVQRRHRDPAIVRATDTCSRGQAGPSTRRPAVRRCDPAARPRLYAGFWDNLGQCCGTAGVGEMALDKYQQTGDKRWLGLGGHSPSMS